jgi:hypothetical protein
MNNAMKRVFVIGLLTVSAGCSNGFNTEIERWNSEFLVHKQSCQNGSAASCLMACRMSREMSVCRAAGKHIDPDNQAQLKWLRDCPQSVMAQGKEVCSRAQPQAQPQMPSTAREPNTTPQPAAPSTPGALESKNEQDAVSSPPSPKRHPRIRAGAAEVKGSLSKEVVRRIVHRHINEVKFCYERQLEKNPNLAGRIDLKFIISDTGEVHSAAIASSTLEDGTTGSCIAEAAKRWVFPKPQGGGIVVVTYPFNLSSSKG